jgi:hypothetical protein
MRSSLIPIVWSPYSRGVWHVVVGSAWWPMCGDQHVGAKPTCRPSHVQLNPRGHQTCVMTTTCMPGHSDSHGGQHVHGHWNSMMTIVWPPDLSGGRRMVAKTAWLPLCVYLHSIHPFNLSSGHRLHIVLIGSTW